jgi:hypothetical protein
MQGITQSHQRRVGFEVKRLISLVLSALLLFSLSACGASKPQNQSPPGNSPSATSSPTDTTGQGTNQPQGASSPTETTGQDTNQPQGDWVKNFEKQLYNGYHVTPSRYKYIGNGSWEVWVKEYDTGELPYVTVNQNTGNFHG